MKCVVQLKTMAFRYKPYGHTKTSYYRLLHNREKIRQLDAKDELELDHQRPKSGHKRKVATCNTFSNISQPEENPTKVKTASGVVQNRYRNRQGIFLENIEENTKPPQHQGHRNLNDFTYDDEIPIEIIEESKRLEKERKKRAEKAANESRGTENNEYDGLNFGVMGSVSSKPNTTIRTKSADAGEDSDEKAGFTEEWQAHGSSQRKLQSGQSFKNNEKAFIYEGNETKDSRSMDGIEKRLENVTIQTNNTRPLRKTSSLRRADAVTQDSNSLETGKENVSTDSEDITGKNTELVKTAQVSASVTQIMKNVSDKTEQIKNQQEADNPAAHLLVHSNEPKTQGLKTEPKGQAALNSNHVSESRVSPKPLSTVTKTVPCKVQVS